MMTAEVVVGQFWSSTGSYELQRLAPALRSQEQET